MDPPLVSFVVMCYNTEAFVGECIQSILNLEGGFSWEVVAIDDCSTDGTLAVLESFSDPRIRIIRHPVNKGPQEAATTALLATRGIFVTRMDSDDRYRPDFLTHTLPILHEHPNVGLVYGEAEMIDPDGKPLGLADTPGYGNGPWIGNLLITLLRRNIICNPTVIARRECFVSSMPVPSHMVLADWYLTVSMAREWDFCFCDRVLADYRIHPGNYHSHIVATGAQERAIMWLLDKVFSTPETLPALELQKRRDRAAIIAENYWTMAAKYFGCGMFEEARRCYMQAARHPRYWVAPELYKRLLAIALGRARYEACKTTLKAAVQQSGKGTRE